MLLKINKPKNEVFLCVQVVVMSEVFFYNCSRGKTTTFGIRATKWVIIVAALCQSKVKLV